MCQGPGQHDAIRAAVLGDSTGAAVQQLSPFVQSDIQSPALNPKSRVLGSMYHPHRALFILSPLLPLAPHNDRLTECTHLILRVLTLPTISDPNLPLSASPPAGSQPLHSPLRLLPDYLNYLIPRPFPPATLNPALLPHSAPACAPFDSLSSPLLSPFLWPLLSLILFPSIHHSSSCAPL